MNKIKLSEMDANFKNEVASKSGAEHFKRCFTCGTCTASCPVAEVNDDYDPRKLIRMILLGMKKETLSSDTIWMCSRCYTCYALCPQGVKFTDVLGVLRDMAVKEGYVPRERLEQAREMDKRIQKLRCELINQKLNPNDGKKDSIKCLLEDELNKKWIQEEK